MGVPLITVAMPVWNVEATIETAIKSIQSQTFVDWEMVIVDDGSTDRTMDVLKRIEDPRIRVISDGRHEALPARLNQCIRMASGKYFARMDGDDVAYPHRLQLQLDFAETHPEVDLQGSWVLVFGKGGTPLGKRAGRLGRKKSTYLFRTIPIAHPTFFGKTNWFAEHTYEVWPSNFQDQHLLLKFLACSNYALLPQILLGYREEMLSVTKQFRYRLSYVETFLPLVRLLGVVPGSVLVASQLAKLIIDIMALKSGLNYHLLRSRAYPLTSAERTQWEQVWQSCNQLELTAHMSMA